MKKQKFLLCLPLLLGLLLPGKDEALEGIWRSQPPAAPDDDAVVHEFVFEKGGGLKMNDIFYASHAAMIEWEPVNAVLLASGDDDTWDTENGYLMLGVREKYVMNRDFCYRYRVEGDTLHLWEAEVYKGKSDQLAGEWVFERMDDQVPGGKVTGKVIFSGADRVEFEGKSGKVAYSFVQQKEQLRLTSASGEILQLSYDLFPKMFCIYDESTHRKLVKRVKAK